MNTTKIQLRIIRHFAGFGQHSFKVIKITGAICAHTLRDWNQDDPKNLSDGPEIHVDDIISRSQADDLTEQPRYEVTVTA